MGLKRHTEEMGFVRKGCFGNGGFVIAEFDGGVESPILSKHGGNLYTLDEVTIA